MYGYVQKSKKNRIEQRKKNEEMYGNEVVHEK